MPKELELYELNSLGWNNNRIKKIRNRVNKLKSPRNVDFSDFFSILKFDGFKVVGIPPPLLPFLNP